MCSGSALAIRNVYMSEYLGSFEEIANPVPLKDFCDIDIQISDSTNRTLYKNEYSSTDQLSDPPNTGTKEKSA